MKDYDGEERREPNKLLEPRVRDLEEKERAGYKSRQALHKQIGDLDVKVGENYKNLNAKVEENHKNLNDKVEENHKNLNTKLDLVLSRMEDNSEDCGEHKTETALLKQAQETLTEALAGITEAVGKIKDDQKNIIYFLAAGLLGIIGWLVDALYRKLTGG